MCYTVISPHSDVEIYNNLMIMIKVFFYQIALKRMCPPPLHTHTHTVCMFMADSDMWKCRSTSKHRTPLS